MADWVVCPGCQLRHSRRADGLCPRCKQAVEAGAPAPSATAIPPPLPSPPPLAGPPPLAPPVRGKELKHARVIMLVVGVLAVAMNGYFFASAESSVQAELDKEIRGLPPGYVADPVKVSAIKDHAVRANRMISGGGLFLGLLFLGCAALVTRHPVPMTITSLALYLGGNAIFGFIDPSTLAAGIVFKLLIVFGLFKAVQAAIAHQREREAVPGT